MNITIEIINDPKHIDPKWKESPLQKLLQIGAFNSAFDK
jgi:hypothetical protein